jgi:acid phosphatase
MRLARHASTAAIVLLLCAAGLASPAQADVVPVDPGPIAANRPIDGTGVNLPALPTIPSTLPYDAGDGFASSIVAYYTQGKARVDQADVAKAALKWTRAWLDDLCGGHKPKQVKDCDAMAVFDIDETLLDNYGYYSVQQPAFSYSSTTWAPYEDGCGSAANASVTKLYRTLKATGMGVALITGRSSSGREATEACLEKNGVADWTTLVMKEQGQQSLTAAAYKARARAALQRDGWRIGPSIGDQISDMAGGRLKHGFLLPNPMYYIP